MQEEKIGEVQKYFDNMGVAVVKLNGALYPGDRIHVRGKNDFEQVVSSLEVDNEQVDAGKIGQEVGIRVEQDCCMGDLVFKISG